MKIETPKDMAAEVDALQQTVLFSRRKEEIVRAFDRLKCIVNGRCVQLSNKAFDDTDFTFEYVRCMLPSRFFQLVKELHIDTRRWAYIQPLYRELLAKVYEDLNPDVPVVSSGEIENKRCVSRESAVLGRATKELEAMRVRGQAKARRLRLMRYKLLKFEFEK